MKPLFTTLRFIGVFVALTIISSCKKNDTSTTTTGSVSLSANSFLGTRWTTTAATAVQKSDGKTVTFTGTNITQLYLDDIIFLTSPSGATAGTANESDYGNLTWTFNSATNNLIVVFSPTDGSVNATVTTLDAHTLVLHREINNPEKNGAYSRIDQTLTR
jgi:hypothetical protein